jgi:hypothetical protein
MFQDYFKTVQQLYTSDKESSEHTYRTAFENLLNSFTSEHIDRKLTVKHEPINQGNLGRPDFKITTGEQLTIGLIETKKIGENLQKILSSKQLENYGKLSDNIIVTDYLHFYLIKKGEPILDVPLFSVYNLQKKRFKIEDTRKEELTRLLKLFFESEPETIYKTRDLALKLAEKAKFLKEYCYNELSSTSGNVSRLHGLFKAFKDTLLPKLNESYFSDIYAQTISYGLFLAALNTDDPKIELNKRSAAYLLPDSFPLIKEFFEQIDNFPKEIVWSIDEIITILKVTDFTAIKKEFAEYRHKESGFNDPFIFFYEDFLYHYDPGQRKIRGVYYTPEPVVSFIVRSIEIILKDTFGLKDGFINKDVTLLDFATGTGTFLLNAFKQAIEQALQIADKKTVNKIINENIIKNFYGFELLVAPYVIAHLKISEYLKEQGFTIDEGNRLKIYLTNTLSNKEPEPFHFMPHLSEEGKQANKIKNDDILVILGNPPYSGHSANVGDWIQNAMKVYYRVDGKPLRERNSKWLQDDYVKFIRFAEWKMKEVEKGIVGIITNHSFLDNPTFRGMRSSLMNSFNEVYILDLHGNTKKMEKAPDGSKDENVFDIQQGVAITILIKNEKTPKSNKIYRSDLFGLREFKNKTLANLDLKSNIWNEIKPQAPLYMFLNLDHNKEILYRKGFHLDSIFKVSSVGIVTARDKFTIKFDKEKLWRDINEFIQLTGEEARQKYKLGKDARDWKVDLAMKDLLKSGPAIKNITRINYRPFDVRFTYYTGNSRGFHCMPRKEIMVNMSENNIALLAHKREELNLPWAHAFVTNFVSEHCAVSIKTTSYHFPLYILSNGEDKVFFGVKESEIGYGPKNRGQSGLIKTPNFKKDFTDFIKSKYTEDYTPEQILGYIYAVLHSLTYRTKYIEFLKIDFPRIPFTDDEGLFRELAGIGFELIEHHLMKKSYEQSICRFHGEGDNFKVEKVDYEDGKAYINKDRYFEPVPEDIWNFYIGGYQVLEKWLKERKKHEIELKTDDILHFISVVNILNHTIKTMNRIDELTREWI